MTTHAAPIKHSTLNADNLTRIMKAVWYGLIALCFAFNSWVVYVFFQYRIFGGVQL